MTRTGCPRCGAELISETFRALGELWCPHCGYLGSTGSPIQQPRDQTAGPQQRTEQEAWLREAISRR